MIISKMVVFYFYFRFIFQIGDQILEVNGQSFMEVTHDEAVNQLKFHKRMSLVVRDVGKVPHSCTAYDDLPSWDPAAAGGPHQLHSPG